MMRHPPKFCPECGKVLFGKNAWIEYWLHFSKNRGYEGIGYDTYCEHCKNGFHIEPDSDANFIETYDKQGRLKVDF